ALDKARGGRAREVGHVLREEAIEPERCRWRDQAAAGLRRRYPARRATTPMLMAESATLNTGQKWTLMKSVTVPYMTLSKPLPSVPAMISPRMTSVCRSPGLRATQIARPTATTSDAT